MVTSSKDAKVLKLLEKVEDLCLADENYFATGWEIGDRKRWVAWIILKPGCQPHVFDIGLPNGGGFAIDQLSESRIDRLLALRWECPKPVGALDKLARATQTNDSGLRPVTISDMGEGGMSDIAKLIILNHRGDEWCVGSGPPPGSQ
jgi:hypothetical protein